MTFTDITNPVPVQPGIRAYNMTASGNIYKGQGVYIVQDNTVAAPVGTDVSQKLFGIAGGPATHGKPIAVYGRLNLCRCKLSGNVTASTLVGLHNEGYIAPNSVGGNFAVVTKGVSSTGEGEILLY